MTRVTSLPRHWVGAVRSRVAGRPGPGPEPGEAEAPARGEHLVGAFARLFGEGGSMEVRHARVEALGPRDLPCVLVLEDGTGIALIEREPGGDFAAAGPEGRRRVPAAELTRLQSGTVLGLAGAGAERPAVAPEPFAAGPLPEADPDPASPIRQIAGATLASPLLPQLILAAALGNIFVFSLPIYSMAVYDRIIPHRAVETLWALTGGILIIFMVDLFCRSMRNRLQEAIGIGISLRLQQALFGRLLGSELAQAQRQAGIVSSGLGALDGACLVAPAILVGALVDLPFTLVILLYVASVAHWVVVAPILAIAAIVGINVASHLSARRAHAASARHLVQRASLIEEAARTLEVLKATGGERHALGRWGQLVDAVSFHHHVGRNAGAWAGQAVGTVLQAGTVLTLVIGVFLINEGNMTVGALSAAILLINRTVSPVSGLASSIVRALSLAEALAHLRTLTQVPREATGDVTRRPRTVEGRIRLSGVGFRYPNEARPALADVSLAIAPGERVGVIGRIGSGKSTLVHLLPRLYTPETGNLLIDDHDVRQYDPVWLRRHVAFMPQDCDLLEATIRENIVRGLDAVDEDVFQKAVHASGVKDFVAGHPAGYGLVVGPGGRRLSGGERQAVCLARTLVRDAPVLVLDEPTSAMDSQLEQQVVERLRAMLAGRTVVIATHRAPLLSLVERIVWLDGGRVVADGPSSEVMRQASRMSA